MRPPGVPCVSCGSRPAVSSAAPALQPQLWPPNVYPDAHISSLGLDGDAEARRLLRRALRDAWPSMRKFGWRVGEVCELDPENGDVGYTAEDGTIFVKVRDPSKGRPAFYAYSFVLATLLHELTHLSYLGHGKAFYRCLVEAVAGCGAEPAVRREVRGHVCAELLNAVCDNDARRARALLAALPEAVACRPPGAAAGQLPLEYAAHHGRVALTRLLLEARADVDAAAGAVPPLARAAARGNSKTAMLLLQAGAKRGLAALSEGPMLAAAAAAAEANEPPPPAAVAQPAPDERQPCRRPPLPGRTPPPLPPKAARRAGSLPSLPMERAEEAGKPAARRLVMLSGSLAL